MKRSLPLKDLTSIPEVASHKDIIWQFEKTECDTFKLSILNNSDEALICSFGLNGSDVYSHGVKFSQAMREITLPAHEKTLITTSLEMNADAILKTSDIWLYKPDTEKPFTIIKAQQFSPPRPNTLAQKILGFFGLR